MVHGGVPADRRKLYAGLFALPFVQYQYILDRVSCIKTESDSGKLFVSGGNSRNTGGFDLPKLGETAVGKLYAYT